MSDQGLILDEWLSELIATEGEVEFLGYRPSATEDDGFPFSLYDMIIEPIRLADANEGNLLLHRFLMGAQNLIETFWAKALAIPSLNRPDVAPDDLLPLLMKHVGFVGNASNVIDVSNEDERRQLAIGAIPIWQKKGTVSGYEYISTLLSGRDVKIYDWFYYLALMDHVIIGDFNDGLSFFAIPNEDTDYKPDRVLEIHVVDEGYQTINRDLLSKLFDTCRVCNERIMIVYSLFIEQFYRNVRTKWVDKLDVLSIFNSDEHYLSIPEESLVIVDADYNIEWTKYCSSFIARYTEENSVWMFMFYSTIDGDRSFYVRITPTFANTLIEIGKVLDSVAQAADASDTTDYLSIDRWTTFRIETEHINNTILVTVYMDGHAVVSNEYDYTFVKRGTIGVSCSVGSVDIKEVEVRDVSQYDYVAPRLLLRPRYIIIDDGETIGFDEQDGVDHDGRIVGGDGEYVFSFVQNESAGTLTDEGLYTAGSPVAGQYVDKVQVTDSRGNTATSTIVVVSA